MFVLRHYNIPTAYNCTHCLAKGVQHEVIDVPGPPTTSSSCWGAGIPTIFKECTGCGDRDGGWVNADFVEG